jgi:L-lactate dehydrogenase complex protein LldE
MIEKRDACRELADAATVQIQFDRDLRFIGVAVDRRLPRAHARNLMRYKAQYCRMFMRLRHALTCTATMWLKLRLGTSPMSTDSAKPRVGLFATCLVDLFRPNVGFAAVELLQRAGCEVDVPALQTCCGQPAYNSGAELEAERIAKQVIEQFEPYDYVVGPSGSCLGMLKQHYAHLFSADARWEARASALASRCHELVSFLTDVMGVRDVDAAFVGKVTYHDSCASLRECGVQAQPRALLQTVARLEFEEMQDTEVCCGFGGTFCVKYPDISTRLVNDKIANIEATGADTLLAGDMGCLMNIAGRLKRLGSDIKVYHVAEVLAGRTHEAPPIGEGEVR